MRNRPADLLAGVARRRHTTQILAIHCRSDENVDDGSRPHPAPGPWRRRRPGLIATSRAGSRNGKPLSGTPSSDIGDRMIRLALRLFAVIVLAGAWSEPASANRLGRGPFADFLNLFQQQPVPRQVVTWRKGHAPGTVVISTGQRRLLLRARRRSGDPVRRRRRPPGGFPGAAPRPSR